jgi:hypothetical protein
MRSAARIAEGDGDGRPRRAVEAFGEPLDLQVGRNWLAVYGDHLRRDRQGGLPARQGAYKQLALGGDVEVQVELVDCGLDPVARPDGVDRADDNREDRESEQKNPERAQQLCQAIGQRPQSCGWPKQRIHERHPNRSPSADSTARCYQYLMGVKQGIRARSAQAACRISNRSQISTRAVVSSSIISAVWCGPGVKRSRSLPRGTVGKLMG